MGRLRMARATIKKPITAISKNFVPIVALRLLNRSAK